MQFLSRSVDLFRCVGLALLMVGCSTEHQENASSEPKSTFVNESSLMYALIVGADTRNPGVCLYKRDDFDKEELKVLNEARRLKDEKTFKGILAQANLKTPKALWVGDFKKRLQDRSALGVGVAGTAGAVSGLGGFVSCLGAVAAISVPGAQIFAPGFMLGCAAGLGGAGAGAWVSRRLGRNETAATRAGQLTEIRTLSKNEMDVLLKVGADQMAVQNAYPNQQLNQSCPDKNFINRPEIRLFP